MQFTEDENSRSYLDFDSIGDALDGKFKLKYLNFNENWLPPFSIQSKLWL